MIVSQASIERSARDAQAAGLGPDACPYPADSPAGIAWLAVHEAAALDDARRTYDGAIAESSCIN